MTLLRRDTKTPDYYNLQPQGRAQLFDKVYMGFVKDTNDTSRMGRLSVWIPEISGGDGTNSNTRFTVNYCSPFAGATSVYSNKPDSNNWQDSQRSYGMWFVPPDVDNQVVCMFINGDASKGIWIGCMYQQSMNNMVPGLSGNSGTSGIPVVEYNKRNKYTSDPDLSSRPEYAPLRDALLTEGLSDDPVRGISSTSARRNDPINSAYGFLTPGGNQLTFDDDPANSFIRIRTLHGAQVLVNDNTGCVYMNSVDGKNWVELSAGGEIDVYAQADISIRSGGSINLRADQDVNIEAGRSIFMKACNEAQGPVPDITIMLDQTDAANQIIGKTSYTYNGNWQSSATGQTSNTSVIFTDGMLVEFRRNVDTAYNLISYTVSGINQAIALTPSPTATTTNSGGLIKMEAVTDFHAMSQQNMYITSMKEMHRASGTNMLDTAHGNLDRRSGGYIHDNSGTDFGVLSSGNFVLSAPRVDVNGPSAPTALSAASATAPVTQSQKDMEIISDGKFRYVLLNTIVPRLPYHEPYTGHSARVFVAQGTVDEGPATGLKPGQIIAGQDKPQDVIGSPLAGMPAGRYTGEGYDAKGNPIYKFDGQSNDLKPVSGYKTTTQLLNFIKRYEGLRYSVYPDDSPKHLPTIGYGHMLTAAELSSKVIIIGGESVSTSQSLTQAQCDTLLAQDMESKSEYYVRKYVKVPVTQAQYDALCSFTFNCGGGNLQKSDLLAALNKGNYADAATLFLNWTGKPTLKGLVTRREAEAAMFRGPPVVNS